jgi:hypothetical protein
MNTIESAVTESVTPTANVGGEEQETSDFGVIVSVAAAPLSALGMYVRREQN